MTKTTDISSGAHILVKKIDEDMKVLIVTVVLLLPLCLSAQHEEYTESILQVLGLMSVEETDPEEFERLMNIIRHPVTLDLGGFSKIGESGLLSSYQLASLKDYISRHGIVLSVTELAAVDGFTMKYAELLKPFVAFGTGLNASRRRTIDGDIDLRTSLKYTAGEQATFSYGLRSSVDYKGKLQLAFSMSRPHEASYCFPSLYCAGVTCIHKYGKLIVGDFNARFGQGLCIWNTASFSSVAAPSSFMKRSSGLSSSHSFTGTYAMTGLASDLNLDKWKVSAYLALPELKHSFFSDIDINPGINLTRNFSCGHVGATGFMYISDVGDSDFRIPQLKTSVDASLCFGGVNLFSEVMCDFVKNSCALVAGTEANVAEHWRMAAMLRYIPESYDHGAAFSCEFKRNRHEGLFFTDIKYDPRTKSSDEKRRQLKAQFRWKWAISEHIHTELRLSERFRTWGAVFRTNVRTDICYENSRWTATARVDFLSCKDCGVLGYMEAGYRVGNVLKVYFRSGLFRIDEWDDRIYVYERDSPGNFNVPSFYGRGVWTSLYLTSKFAGWGQIYLRASYVGYPLMHENQKPGRAELKLQFSLFI